jgi:acyl-CoA reductase-like NAD-dependent aldehyde dehydrogenase
VRLVGEGLPLDISERARDYSGMWKRVPIGPCSFISPFNFPLNLAAHKVAPALAVGCPFVLKPASLTPIGALTIGEVLAECDLPRGAFSILPCRRDGARLFTEDPRLELLSFTGSPSVGWALKAQAGKKKVVLELGGNAACIVDEGADVEDAVARVVNGAFYQSGQSCISVQRIMVPEPARRGDARAHDGGSEGSGHVHRSDDLRGRGRAPGEVDHLGAASWRAALVRGRPQGSHVGSDPARGRPVG